MPNAPTYTILGDLEYETVVFPPELIQVTAKPVAGKSLAVAKSEASWLRLQILGGSWMVAEAVRSALELLPQKSKTKSLVRTYERPKHEQTAILPQSLIELGEFPSEDKLENDDRRILIRRSIGWSTLASARPADDYKSLLGSLLDSSFKQAKGAGPEIAIVDDHNRGFRYSEADSAKKVIRRSDQIIWDMFTPIANGSPLWKTLGNDDIASKTILVLHEDALRIGGMNIREEGSIERAIEQFADHIESKKSDWSALKLFSDVVVRFEGGAFHYSSKDRWVSCYSCKLPKSTSIDEGGQSSLAGYSTIITCSIAKALEWWHTQGSANPELRSDAVSYGVRLGIKLCELFKLIGYHKNALGVISEESPQVIDPYRHVFELWSKHREEVVPTLPKRLHKCQFSQLRLDLATYDPQNSLRRRVRYEDFWKLKPPKAAASKKTCFEAVEQTAISIIRFGLDQANKRLTEHVFGDEENYAPKWLPPLNSAIAITKFGQIETIFRDEIDAFGAIESLVKEYLENTERTAPLNFAVFGAPGAGKGFTVKQVLSRLPGDGFNDPLTFNMAQFKTVNELGVALHQVQDRVLSQKMPPLVFFDEFDCRLGNEAWGWLKYFLAPMQDGQFKDGETVYRIGRAVFVFAGGIHRSFAAFNSAKSTASPEHKSSGMNEFKAAKGPDFVSRLRGYLDIQGIDHGGKGAKIGSGDSANRNTPLDPAVVLRRAIILRQLLAKSRKEIIDSVTKEARIDEDVVKAFLRVPKFEHGVRSMEAIVEMSRMTGDPARFTLPSIPTRMQLQMHVTNTSFFSAK